MLKKADCASMEGKSEGLRGLLSFFVGQFFGSFIQPPKNYTAICRLHKIPNEY